MVQRREWKEVWLPRDERAPLVRSVWKHIHSDGSEHDTKVDYPRGVYGGTVGEIPSAIVVRCLTCGAVGRGGEPAIIDTSQFLNQGG